MTHASEQAVIAESGRDVINELALCFVSVAGATVGANTGNWGLYITSIIALMYALVRLSGGVTVLLYKLRAIRDARQNDGGGSDV